MNLYDINKELEIAFESCVDPETGEVVGDTSVLDELAMARDAKIENLALYIKNLKADAKALKEEEGRLKKRRETCENRLKWLTKYLSDNLHGEKFKTARAAISFREVESIEVTDVWELPEDLRRYKDPEPDKALIKAAIKAGQQVKGAELVKKLSMTIK